MRFKIYQLIMNILVIQIQLTFIQCTSFRKVLVKQKVITHTYSYRCHVINNYNFWFQSLKWYSVHETENIKFLLLFRTVTNVNFIFHFASHPNPAIWSIFSWKVSELMICLYTFKATHQWHFTYRRRSVPYFYPASTHYTSKQRLAWDPWRVFIFVVHFSWL